MKTRAKKSSAKGAPPAAPSSTRAQVKTLEPSVAQPPHLFILPERLSSAARIVTFPNPATSAPCRYLICPERGCYEFTRVTAPRKACKSWLLAPDRDQCKQQRTDGSEETNRGYALQSPDLMIATPVDPLFLILPALVQDAQDGGRQFHLPLSDYLDRMARDSPHFQEMLREDGSKRLEQCLEARMVDVSSSLDDGTEVLYKLSIQKVLGIILQKAEKIVENGLPATMEDQFVKQLLAVPISNIRHEETEVEPDNEPDDINADGVESEASSTSELSQVTRMSTTTTVSTTHTVATFVSIKSTTSDPAEGVLQLLRLRTALDFILRSYVPDSLRTTLSSALSQSANLVDFKVLDDHLARLEQVKKEAVALRSLSDNISRKRGAEEDDEGMERAEAKKRKKEEEDLKKKNMSRGVKQLQKADRSGMKTLSSFFGTAALKKS